ncbi:LysM peptidoglycan-binding domain-containing protein [Candidatus Thiosymbion oneisti]|uniref:LysM peptidoglycan-binding domain-containing protein n=1 Tax=Candidatus Thiosymbion oneisti TaxID=589554 RepID=UPI00105F0524|nr:LysM domain-containing protein [Candidatus Thiosymbion oneisti]
MSNVYTVKQGDCLWNIAKAHGLLLGELLNVNPQFTKKHGRGPDSIYPGEKVTIPAEGKFPLGLTIKGIVTCKKKPCPPCPKYASVDTSKDSEHYNCAGLAHRTYTYMSDLKEVKKRLSAGTKLTDCSKKCSPCQVKHWLWELKDWKIEFKDKKGKVHLSTESFPPDFHTVSGRCDCNGNDPTNVYSTNGERPLEGPKAPSDWRLKTGDPITENGPKNREVYIYMKSLLGPTSSDFYDGASISSGMDISTKSDVKAGFFYLKGFLKIISEIQSCYCFNCP